MYFFSSAPCIHRCSVGKIDGPGKWNNTHLNQCHLAVGQNPVPLVNIKLGGKWMFIYPKMEP